MTHSTDVHCEWSGISGISRKFTVDVVCDSAESESYWQDRCHLITHLQKWEMLLVREPHHRKDDSDNPTMEAHPTVPKSENLVRISEIVGKSIEEHIPQSSSEDNSDENMHQKTIECSRIKYPASLNDLVSNDETKRVCKSVVRRSNPQRK